MHMFYSNSKPIILIKKNKTVINHCTYQPFLVLNIHIYTGCSYINVTYKCECIRKNFSKKIV